MLNRTLKTKSATLNRHDLGTRLFARVATTNMGPMVLRLRHAHPQAVVEIARAGFILGLEYPPSGGESRPESPGSSSLRPWYATSCVPVAVVEAQPDRPSVVLPDDRSRRFGVRARAMTGTLAATLAGGPATG